MAQSIWKTTGGKYGIATIVISIVGGIAMFATAGTPNIYIPMFLTCMLALSTGILSIGFMMQEETTKPIVLIIVLPLLGQLYFVYFLYLNGGATAFGSPQ